jgi:cell division protein FtsB
VVTGEHLTDAVSRTYWLVKPVSVFLYYVLPDMQHFQLRNNVVYGPAPTAAEFLGSIFYGVGYAAAVLLLAAIVFDGNMRRQKSDGSLSTERAALVAERAEYERVRDELRNINTPEFFERILRRELGMVRPDETIFIVMENGE